MAIETPRRHRQELRYPIVQEATFRDLKAGDKVICTSGDRTGQRFEFVKHVVNMNSGKEWLTCWGGKAGRQSWQYFHVDQLERV